MLDYLEKSGANTETIADEREQQQNDERQRAEKEKLVNEKILSNDDEIVKGFVKEFNTLFYQNVRGLLEKGWITASIKLWTMRTLKKKIILQ